MRVFKNSVFVVVLVSAAWIVARAECAVPIVNYSFENSAIGSAPSGWYGYSGGTADGTVASVSGLTGADRQPMLVDRRHRSVGPVRNANFEYDDHGRRILRVAHGCRGRIEHGHFRA